MGMKKRVTGIGGIFFKCTDPQKSKDWYREHLGIDAGEYGANIKWREHDDREKIATTVWSPFPGKTDYFNPSQSEFMINYRVENLEALLEQLQKEGVEIVGDMESYEYGKFAWIMDPDGRKIELWEPANEDIL
jgi:predicted enzyme related to lactoylglutathione lyase